MDKPELGLHPYAINVLASLIKFASENKQVIVSTQSVELLDEFDAEDIIVVNRENRRSIFIRPDEEELSGCSIKMDWGIIPKKPKIKSEKTYQLRV